MSEQKEAPASKQTYRVKAKIERKGRAPFWLTVGTVNLSNSGVIVLTLDALPLHSKDVMALFPVDSKSKTPWSDGDECIV